MLLTNLKSTQYNEEGYEQKLITGAAFMDLSAAHDTINHQLLQDDSM